MKIGRCVAPAALAATVLTLGSCGSSPATEQSDSGAGCFGPWLDNEPTGVPPDSASPSPTVAVSPGATIKIYGHGYTSTCNDTGEGRALQPLGAVDLTLTLANGAQEQLGTFTPEVAAGDAGFVANVTIPSTAAAGTAVVSDNNSPPDTVSIEVRD